MRPTWPWLILGGAWLLLSRSLPLEADVHAPLGVAWFCSKMLADVAALMPALYGLGQLPWRGCQAAARRLPRLPWADEQDASNTAAEAAVWAGERPASDTAVAAVPAGERLATTVAAARRLPRLPWAGEQNASNSAAAAGQEGCTGWLDAAITLLLGTATLGLLTFVTGLVWAPSPWQALSAAYAGYALCAWRWPRWRLPERRRRATAGELGLAGLAALLIALRLADACFFQGQEDAYLYHLRLAQVWISEGHSGVVLHNIYSGYALCIEHYYLFLKLLLRGDAEQNAAAQLSHLVVGYGAFVAALRALGGRWFGGVKTTCLVLACLNTTLIAPMILPKNDGFLAAAVMAAVYGLTAGEAAYLLAGASVAMAIKPTAGLLFVVLGLVQLAVVVGSRSCHRWRGLAALALVLGAAAAVMVLGWAAFAWRNAAVTGDPFFPLLGELFPTPYAPGLRSVIVEAAPFSLSFGALLGTTRSLISSQANLTLGLACAVVALAWPQQRRTFWLWLKQRRTLVLLGFGLSGFYLLEEVMGRYGDQVAARHFAPVLGALLLVSLGSVFSLARTRRQLLVLASISAAVSVAYSSADVSARELVRHLGGGNLTDGIVAKKPILALNVALTRYLKDLRPPLEQARVYAATESNAGLFLDGAEFWHASMTYPAWTWGPLGGAALACKLAAAHVDFLYTDASSQLPGGVPGQAVPLARVDAATLWRLRPPASCGLPAGERLP